MITLQVIILINDKYTAKPVLTTISEQRPPVNYEQPESPTQLKWLQNFALTFDHLFNNSHFLGIPKEVFELRFEYTLKVS